MVPENSADQSAERSRNIQYPTASMRPPEPKMEHRPPADNALPDNALPHFLTMMVRAPRAVDLLAKSSGCGWRGHEADECGLPGPFARGACEPVADTVEVDGGCGERVLEVRLGQPDVAGPAQVHDAGTQ